MRLKIISAFVGLFILLIFIAAFIYTNHTGHIFNNEKNLSISITPNPISTVIPSVSIEPNNTLEIPPNDFVINHINWSSYPNLQSGYVYTVYIAEPTNIVPHKFIEVQILTEVKGTENRTIIREQLSGIALEARKIYGPNSDINIHGTKGGASTWIVSLLPYEDIPY
jgi:hypothetical protein